MNAPITEGIEITLTVDTRVQREGKEWIVSCPSLGLVAQNKTLASAKKSFADVLTASIEMWHERGFLAQVLKRASADPSGSVKLSPARSRQPVSVPVPVEFMAASYAAKKETVRRKAA